MKYYIIAGEASGDLHGSNLVKALFNEDAEAELRGWGGDKMQEAGVELIKHIRDLAFMGFTEVLANLGTIFSNIKYCKKDIEYWQPDALILIDYPGFNLRIADWAHEKKIKVIYYISPQVWAWHESRVHKIKKIVDLMIVILPFEKDFYARFNYTVKYVGHPLLDIIPALNNENKLTEENKPVVALLPGSRKQEIRRMLPVMLSVVKDFPDFQFMLACAPSINEEYYDEFLDQYPQVKKFKNKTYDLLKQSSAALVTSGTATLETALFGVPEVVCYKGNALSYLIAKRLIKVKYISLVNLIMDKEIVKELIQDECNSDNLKQELRVLMEPIHRKVLHENYILLREKLGNRGASERAAVQILQFLESGVVA